METKMVLHGQEPVVDQLLGCIAEKDPRSRAYPIADITAPLHYTRFRSYTWAPGPTLNQGSDGACVGFAWAHELAARPAVISGVTARFAYEHIYFEAQKLDQYPGGAYPGAYPYSEGTSILAGAKAIQSLGFMGEYRWAFSFLDLVAAVGYRGPAIFGCKWFEGMHKVDREGFVQPVGGYRGMHCVAIIGVKIVKDNNDSLSMSESFFKFQNSWGTEWGDKGIAKLRFQDVLELWDGAETCIPVVRYVKPVS